MEIDSKFAAFREQWLEDIREGNPSTVKLGNRFARKILTQWLDIDEHDDEIIYCDGSGDGGIDVAYLYITEADSDSGDSVETHTWYLIQSKYGSAFQGNSTLLKEGQKLIDTLDKPNKRLSSLTQEVLEQLSAFKRRASERDRIVLVFATENSLSNSERQTLSDLRAMGRNRLGTIFDVESISLESIYRNFLEDNLASSRRISIPFFANPTSPAKPEESLLVCSINLMNLYKFLESYQEKTGDIDQIYEKNVRRFLGGRGKVNGAIQKTLKDAPEQFGFYNNGITIVVTDFSVSGNGNLRLTDPFIVNGCQTTRSIWDVFRKRMNSGGTGVDPEYTNWLERVNQGIVVTKIVKVGENGELLLQNITRFTNSQNAVKEKDFLTLIDEFKKWKSEMQERYGIFLEIQRGAWESQKAKQKQSQKDEFTDHANAFDLLKVYGSGWMGEAGAAFGRNAAFLPNGSSFKKIVNNDGSDTFEVDDLYVAYLLQQSAEKYSFGRSGKSTRRLTRFLYYSVVVDILKNILVFGDLSHTRRDITVALFALFKSSKQDLILDSAIEAIDEYMIKEGENSIFNEIGFQNMNNNINGYLKSDQIGKGEIYRRLIADYGRYLGKGKQSSPRDEILNIVRIYIK